MKRNMGGVCGWCFVQRTYTHDGLRGFLVLRFLSEVWLSLISRVVTYKTVFLTIPLCFPSVLRHDLHDDSFYSIMPVWQQAIVLITSAGVFLRAKSLHRDVTLLF